MPNENDNKLVTLADLAEAYNALYNRDVMTTATQSTNGLMSSTDKTKLDGIAAGAQVNSITSVNNQTGAVSITPASIGAAVADTHKYAMYDSVDQLGFSSGTTIANAWRAMPSLSILIADANASNFTSDTVPNNMGIVEIIKNSNSRSVIHFYGKTPTNRDYRMWCDNSSGAPNGTWYYSGQQILLAENNHIGDSVTFDRDLYQTIMIYIKTSADPTYVFLPAKGTISPYWVLEGFSKSGFKVGLSNGSVKLHQTDMKNNVTFTSFSVYGIT